MLHHTDPFSAALAQVDLLGQGGVAPTMVFCVQKFAVKLALHVDVLQGAPQRAWRRAPDDFRIQPSMLPRLFEIPLRPIHLDHIEPMFFHHSTQSSLSGVDRL